MAGLGLWEFLSIGAFALFSFLAVASWSDFRYRERLAYYTNETLRKVAEMQTDGARVAVEFLREQEREAERRLREGIKVGGLVTAAVGLGIMVFMRVLIPGHPIYLAGVIPLLIGLALMACLYFPAPAVRRG
jgi:hypothetical protein